MEQTSEESNCLLPHSKISGFINKISQMSRNASIESDLSQVLDEFLFKVSECDKYLENGIFNMNFAEAALLLQSSANLYSKKVDLLWDIIFDYQKRILLSEEQNEDKNQEIEKLEERKRKYKRRRKTNLDEAQTSKLVNNFSFGTADNVDYLNQNYEANDLVQEWGQFHSNKQLTDISHDPSTSQNSLFLPNTSIYTEDDEFVGRYDQFHSASLIEEIFNLEKANLLADDNCVTKMRIDSYVMNDFFLQNSIPSDTPYENYSKDLDEYIKQFMESHTIPEKENQSNHHAFPEISCSESYVPLQKVPSNVIQDKIARRTSMADSLFEDDHISDIQDTSEPLDQLTRENRSKSCSQDSAFFEDEDPNHEETDVSAAKDVSIATDASLATETDDTAVTVDVVLTMNVTNVETDPKPTVDVVVTMDVTNVTKAKVTEEPSQSAISDTRPCMGSSVIVTRPKVCKRWASLLDNNVKEEKIKKRKIDKVVKISAKKLEKLATGLTVMCRDFEKFCRLQYKPAHGEGTVSEIPTDSEESDEDDEDNNNDLVLPEIPPTIQETENDNPELPTLDGRDCPETDPGLPSRDELDPILSPIHDFPSSSQVEERASPLDLDNLEEDELMQTNVRDWRTFIVPKLRTMEQKADFNIRAYEEKILDPSEIGEERFFKDVVKGQTPKEVAKYFLAMLQLANSHNVEISGNANGEIANDSFQIKTLDKSLPHKKLEQYQAPSEESFRERLERVKALNPQMHSTPATEPPVKKPKVSTYSRKKLF